MALGPMARSWLTLKHGFVQRQIGDQAHQLAVLVLELLEPRSPLGSNQWRLQWLASATPITAETFFQR